MFIILCCKCCYFCLRKHLFNFTLAAPADGTEDEAKIIVDPQPDAVLRLGQFIGDKAYFRDFLSTRSNYKCEQE